MSTVGGGCEWKSGDEKTELVFLPEGFEIFKYSGFYIFFGRRIFRHFLFVFVAVVGSVLSGNRLETYHMNLTSVKNGSYLRFYGS